MKKTMGKVQTVRGQGEPATKFRMKVAMAKAEQLAKMYKYKIDRFTKESGEQTALVS